MLTFPLLLQVKVFVDDRLFGHSRGADETVARTNGHHKVCTQLLESFTQFPIAGKSSQYESNCMVSPTSRFLLHTLPLYVSVFVKLALKVVSDKYFYLNWKINLDFLVVN